LALQTKPRPFSNAKDGKIILMHDVEAVLTHFRSCPPRQTTGDFLTAVTNPQERKPRKGMESKVPRTPEEFEKYWRESPEYQALLEDIADFEAENPINEHATLEQLRQQKNHIQVRVGKLA
jgi:hypothetical protein